MGNKIRHKIAASKERTKLTVKNVSTNPKSTAANSGNPISKNSNSKIQSSIKPAPRVSSSNGSQNRNAPFTLPQERTYSIPDYRLEKSKFSIKQVSSIDGVRYEVSGDFDAPVPPIRDSKYLDKKQCIEIYRYMLLNRKMEQALENLYKQGKVVGGVYFGLGQEACSCASAYALGPEDWFGPMIRNQGSLLVRGFAPRDTMMQYMAKADSPTGGRDGTSHFGDIYKRNMVSPISMLGDLIPVLAGVALGARLQGKNVAVMTYIGDGGQSTGVTYEGINFAAVQDLGLVLLVESNLWAYSTPSDMQYRIEDLAERAIGYGIPGVIVDGTDACQVYDVARDAVERARRGEGPTLIEAKMMRMKGHAIHDGADYVPKPMFEYWRKRDPITRFENYLLNVKKWLTHKEHDSLIAEVESYLEKEREFAVNSPLPAPETAMGGVYCEDGCHEVKPKYGVPKVSKGKSSAAAPKESEAALHFK
jgi:TPP-dependent pyruvate/acetoin dehydrogenase alpha subunit